MPCIGIVLILCLRTYKEKEQLQILELNETEYRSNKGTETTYLKECWETEDKKRKDCKSINTN